MLKPGGRFLSLDFGKPRSGAWRSVYFAYLRLSVPVMGKLFCGDREAYAYILPSLENYAAQRGTAQLMQELGFHDTGFIDLWGGAMAINYGSKPTVH